jgi:MOSC domain-containing protein YiiM
VLRQLIRATAVPSTLHPFLVGKTAGITQRVLATGRLSQTDRLEIQVLALDWESSELGHADQIDRLERRTDERSLPQRWHGLCHEQGGQAQLDNLSLWRPEGGR